MENLASLIDDVRSDDADKQLNASSVLRKILDSGPNPPFKGLIFDAGILPRFVSFLDREELPKLQFEALGILTLFSNKSEYLTLLADIGVLPKIVKLLSSPQDLTRALAILITGNIAQKFPRLYARVLGNHALELSMAQFTENNTVSNLRDASSVLREFCNTKPRKMGNQVLDVLHQNLHSTDKEILVNACRTFASLCGVETTRRQVLSKPDVPAQLIQLLNHKDTLVVVSALQAMTNIATADQMQTQVLPVLQQFLQSSDKEILINACGILASLCSVETTRSEVLSKPSSVCAKLIELLRHDSPLVVVSALEAVTNIASGDETHIQCIIDLGTLPQLLRLLLGDNYSVKKGACKAVSNIANGNNNQIQEVVAYGIVYALADLFESLEIKIKQDVARAISLVTSQATFEAIKIVREKSIKPLHVMLEISGSLLLSKCDLTNIHFYFKSLPNLLRLLYSNHDNNIKKEVCKVFSNIANGRTYLAQEFVAYGIVYALVDLFESSEIEIKQEVARVISYVTSHATHEAIKIVSKKCIKPLCDMLDCSDSAIITNCLVSLERITKVWRESDLVSGNSINIDLYLQMIEEAKGLEKSMNLRYHDDVNVSFLAKVFLKTNWPRVK